LGDRLFQVYNTLKKRHRFVILIGADSPLIHIDHFSETFKSLISGTNFVLGPAYDMVDSICLVAHSIFQSRFGKKFDIVPIPPVLS